MKKIIGVFFLFGLVGCGNEALEKNEASERVERVEPAVKEKECDLSKFKLQYCLMGGGSFGPLMSKENKDLSTLVRNGNYTYSTHWEGAKCFIDIHVDGIVKGNSYKTTRKCEVDKYSKDYMQ